MTSPANWLYPATDSLERHETAPVEKTVSTVNGQGVANYGPSCALSPQGILLKSHAAGWHKVIRLGILNCRDFGTNLARYRDIRPRADV
jgi:hypothetical protein